MAKKHGPRSSVVREPVQVYLAGDDSALLARLVEETGLSKAEILRRGVRSFAREQDAPSPMRQFMEECAASEWPAGPPLAEDHDAILAEEYLGRRRRPR